jgi:hypothetical protein
VSCEHRQTDSPCGGASVGSERRPGGEDVGDAALPGEPPARSPHKFHDGRHRHRVAGTGSELPKAHRGQQGGSIATAGGLVFIGATDDSRFRAFDARTGKELWVAKLNASSAAVPSTYQGADGRQLVVVTATGPYGGAQTADEVVAFALKKTLNLRQRVGVSSFGLS